MTLAGPVTFAALGTTASVLTTDPKGLCEAVSVVKAELDDIDRACSRFRPDSELAAVNQAAGRPVTVSPLCCEAVAAALRAARLTAGVVDPTVGKSLQLAGYDRNFALVAPDGPPFEIQLRPVAGWETVVLDQAASTVRVPAGVELDLGATAKAWCADRAANRAGEHTGMGVLVSLGGDVAVAGPTPEPGWPIRISENHADALDTGGPVVTITSGGLATSSTSVRRWARGGRVLHHLIDPSTGAPTSQVWRTVSVAAGSCLDANIASCAAVIMGAAAPQWLKARGLPARLVGVDGAVVTIEGWPAEEGLCT
jgi:FAD:protein FMN transferase